LGVTDLGEKQMEIDVKLASIGVFIYLVVQAGLDIYYATYQV
jgi:hypothetical protein